MLGRKLTKLSGSRTVGDYGAGWPKPIVGARQSCYSARQDAGFDLAGRQSTRLRATAARTGYIAPSGARELANPARWPTFWQSRVLRHRTKHAQRPFPSATAWLVRLLARPNKDEPERILEERFYTTNVFWGRLGGDAILALVRAHWRIENNCFAACRGRHHDMVLMMRLVFDGTLGRMAHGKAWAWFGSFLRACLRDMRGHGSRRDCWLFRWLEQQGHRRYTEGQQDRRNNRRDRRV